MSAPTFSQTSWLSIVHGHDPTFYADPVAYEFSGGRKFTKNDANWYSDYGHLSFTDDGITFTADKLEF